MKKREIKKIFKSLRPNETLVWIKTERPCNMFLRFKSYSCENGVFVFSDGSNSPIHYRADGRYVMEDGKLLPQPSFDIVEIQAMSIDDFVRSVDFVEQDPKSFLSHNAVLKFLLG